MGVGRLLFDVLPVSLMAVGHVISRIHFVSYVVLVVYVYSSFIQPQMTSTD